MLVPRLGVTVGPQNYELFSDVSFLLQAVKNVLDQLCTANFLYFHEVRITYVYVKWYSGMPVVDNARVNPGGLVHADPADGQ